MLDHIGNHEALAILTVMLLVWTVLIVVGFRAGVSDARQLQ